MLQINNLSVSYNTKENKINALGPINLKVPEGKISVIIGPSGCGKSTFLNVLSGIIKNYEGEVLLNNRELSPLNHNIGVVPQNFGLLPWKTVKENCLLPFKIKKVPVNKDKIKLMNYILNILNITSLVDRYPSELSGGQKQRVAIARSFIMEPDLLLMDEPFSALDAIISEDAQELFLKLWQEYKKTTFIVTHNIREALYLGQEILLLSNHPGKIVKQIQNPFFQQNQLEGKREYLKLYSTIKNYIRMGWNN